jgi:RimJ/RimL family protein N-acetyltransferase
MSIAFRPFAAGDLPLLDEWLNRPHVAEWWRPDETTIPETLDAIEGRDSSDHYLILLDGRPVGMIQTYIVADHPEWEALVHVGQGVAGVDLLIGEEELIGRGLGPEILGTFVREIVFARPGTHAVVAGVEPGNARSLRAFEKAGFVSSFEYEEEGRPHRLMRLERGR